MNSRNLLRKIINGGEAKESRQRTYSVIHGNRQLIDDRPIEGFDDMEIDVITDNPELLEIQQNPYNKK